MPFWKAAEQLGAVILFHQGGETIVDRRIKRYHLPNSVGNLADRTLTFASLVMGGVMDACPDLRICLSPRRRVRLLRRRPHGSRLGANPGGGSSGRHAAQRVPGASSTTIASCTPSSRCDS